MVQNLIGYKGITLFTTDNSAFSDNNGQIFSVVRDEYYIDFSLILMLNSRSSALFNGNTNGTLNVIGTGTALNLVDSDSNIKFK